uniref:Interleukin-9 receptor n=1 Tax=Macrostomum lignano TaxID=282301 RepID=A0A1I8FYW3_9PLAT
QALLDFSSTSCELNITSGAPAPEGPSMLFDAVEKMNLPLAFKTQQALLGSRQPNCNKLYFSPEQNPLSCASTALLKNICRRDPCSSALQVMETRESATTDCCWTSSPTSLYQAPVTGHALTSLSSTSQLTRFKCLLL